MTSERKIRCLLAMLGTDVHTKGIRTLAQLLRDQGVEVIYLGEHNTVAGVVNAIIQEDADVVGLSFSSAAYLSYTEQLTSAMRGRGLADVPVMIGGQIHPDDRPKLIEIGVTGVFGPGSTMPEIMDYLSRVTALRTHES